MESSGVATETVTDTLSEPAAFRTPPPLPESYREKLLPWYFQKNWIIIVALNVPPLALPMIIGHPTLSLRSKILYTLLIPLLVWILWFSVVKTWEAVGNLVETLESMGIW